MNITIKCAQHSVFKSGVTNIVHQAEILSYVCTDEFNKTEICVDIQ